jgi:Tol biopolymer transport system component
MHPDGTHRVALTHYTGGTLALADDWSPDGTQILFNRVALSATNTSSDGLGHFYIMNLTTRHTRRLTDALTSGYDRAAWARKPD